MTNLRGKVFSGAIWAMLERISVQVLGFVVTMVLARLLTPSDYGTVALITICTAIAGDLVDGGLGKALVQKKNANDLDFNSVFYVSLVLSAVVYVILFAVAPHIASFYRTPELVWILRAMSLIVVFSAINSIQNAELNRRMLFKLSFRISLISSVAGAVVGMSLAALKFGPWALVGQTVVSSFASVVARWFIIAWRPRAMFSWSSVRELWRFGWKMVMSSLVNTLYSNLYGILIGRLYSRADLAFVNNGQHLPRLLMDSINGTLGRVAFPALAQIQDDADRLRDAMRRMIQCSTFLVFPLMMGLAITAHSVILLLLGTQWEGAVPYVQLACFSFSLWPFHTINLQAITAIGRSDLYLKLEIIKIGIGLLMLALSVRHGVLTFMMVSAFVTGPIGLLVNAWPNWRILHYSVRMQLLDVLPSFCLSMFMGMCVWAFGFACKSFFLTDVNQFVRLVLIVSLQILLGSVIYFGCSIVFKIRPVVDLSGVLATGMQQRFPLAGKILKRIGGNI